MDVPRAAQALAPRARQPQGLESEVYLNSTSQGELVLSVAEGTPEDARLPARRAYSSERRTAISVVIAGDSRNIRARAESIGGE